MRLLRALVAAWRAFRAELVGPAPAETVPAVHEPDTPAPTADEVAQLVVRFSKERAPIFPNEALAFAVFVETYATAMAPSLAAYRLALAASSPPAPEGAPN